MPRRARVVVTTYERLPLLRLALRAWARQTCSDFALTVADDGSGPGTAEVVREFARAAPFPVDHVWQENRGFRKARVVNEAVRRGGDEPLIVLTDGDCLPPAWFVERHLAAHRPRSFAVGGVVRVGRKDTEALTEAAVDAGAAERFWEGRDRADLRLRAWKSRMGVWLRRRRRPKVLGANIGVDRALFEEVNGYDERFEGYGLEDSDLRDRVMATRPRPAVAVLYGRNDVVHLWHTRAENIGPVVRSYYESERPVRCLQGLRGP